MSFIFLICKIIFNISSYYQINEIRWFLNSIEIYLNNNDFYRDENGYINHKYVLQLVKFEKRSGLRVQKDILGHDRKRYIVKAAEGYKGSISGFKNAKDAKYNPSIAYAFFKYINEPCARNLISLSMLFEVSIFWLSKS